VNKILANSPFREKLLKASLQIVFTYQYILNIDKNAPGLLVLRKFIARLLYKGCEK